VAYSAHAAFCLRRCRTRVFPNRDPLRIMNSRQDRLQWMHRHVAHTVVTGSDLLAEVEAEAAVDEGETL